MRKSLYLSLFIFRFVVQSNFSHYHISIITTHVVITRKICRYNEKISRYYEKICRFNKKRCRYYEKICRFNEKRCHYNEKICRFNEKRSRYYEKRSRYNEKRSRYNDIIEWKKYYMDGSITSPSFIDTVG